MDDNDEKPADSTSVIKEKYIQFSTCGRYKIEPEVDLGITTLENEENTYNSDASDEKIIVSYEISDKHCKADDKLFCAKVEDISKVSKLLRRERLKCSICNYSTLRSDHLKSHLATHSDNRPYQCPFCSFRSKRPYSLQEHISTHSDEKPFTCDLCDYSAKKKFNLYEHMKTHSQSRERPFFCSVCGHRSIRSSHFKSHMKLHVDYRPYKCSQCDYTAKRSGHLKSHMKKHDKE